MEPPALSKALIIDGFHIHIRKVMGLQSFFVFYGPSGIVIAAWLVLPYKERLGRVQIDPLLQVKRIQHSHAPYFFVCWQH